MQSCFGTNGVCKVAVLFLILCLMKRGSAISFEEFVGYPFNEANGYSIFPRGFDLKYGLPIPVPFPYFGRTFSYANIDDSGYISLLDVNTSDSNLPLATPYNPTNFPLNPSNRSGIDWSAVIAPYWYDVDTRSNRSGRIYYKNVTRDTDSDVIGEIDSLAKPHLCGFATTWALIVTWDHVGLINNYDKLNTFQVIIATNGLRSIAVFNYAENGINRAGGAIAGYNVNIDGGNRHFKLPGSLSDDIQYIDNTTGNTCRQGQWVFSLNDFLTPPTQLTALEISTTSFTVSWKPPLEYLQNGGALCYVITVNRTNTEGENVLVFQSKVNSTVLQLSVAELLPDYAHQVSVYAVLRDWSGPAALVWIRTSPIAIPPPIDGFTASSPTSTSISLLWEEPRATIDYYKLTIHSVQASTTEHSDLFRTVTSHTFHNLSPATAYSVTITAVNKGKSGPPVSLNVTTQGTPVPPRINGFTASSPTSTSIAVLWNPTMATIDYYKLTIHSVEANTTEHSDLFRTVTSHTFHNLSPATAYSVTITAVNKGKSGPPVSLNVTTQETPVPPRINGFTASSPTSTSIAVLWNPTMAVIDYYKLTIHSVEANTTEHSDLFRTVTSHTFHNLSPATAYSVTITAVNKGKSGPPVSLNVTTQGIPDSHSVSPLAIATGVLGAMVAIGIVAVPLLIGCTCRLMHKRKVKDQAAPAARAADDDFNFELQENVAYATTPHNKQMSEGCCVMEEKEEEEERSEENNTSVKGNTVPLEPAIPKLPVRQYLLEKESGPTEFASIPVFDEMDFKRNSGWYKPTVADVISKKLGVDAAVFADLGSGVYLMRHRTKEKAKWVGLSPDLCRTLCGLFFQLYLKQHCELNPLQVELKFFSPNAADWDIQVWFTDPKDLLLERAKKIVEFKTLTPLGLNNSLKFTTKEMWEEFTGWCAAQRRQHS